MDNKMMAIFLDQVIMEIKLMIKQQITIHQEIMKPQLMVNRLEMKLQQGKIRMKNIPVKTQMERMKV